MEQYEPSLLSKPPWGTYLNYDHPSARGLACYAPCWEGSGQPFNLLINTTRASLTGTLNWLDTPLGLSRDSPSSGGANYETHTHGNGPGSFSAVAPWAVEIWTYVRSLTGTVGLWNATLTNSGVISLALSTSKPSVTFLGNFPNSATTLTTNKPYQILVTYDGGYDGTKSSQGNLYVYINGVPDGSSTAFNPTWGTVYTWSQTATFRDSTTTNGPNASISSLRVWNRYVPPGEANDLYANPWAMHLPPSLRRFFTTASIVTGAGTASGDSTATGVGASTVASAGTASATSSATGVGASTAASAGTASATSTATGVGTGIVPAVGTASASSTASGVGADTTDAVGTASADSTASGVGHAIINQVSAGGGPHLQGVGQVWAVHPLPIDPAILTLTGSAGPAGNVTVTSAGGGVTLSGSPTPTRTWTATSTGGVRLTGASDPFGALPTDGGIALQGSSTPTHTAVPTSSPSPLTLGGSVTPTAISRLSIACACNSYSVTSAGGGPRLTGSVTPTTNPIRSLGGGPHLTGRGHTVTRTNTWGGNYKAVWWLSELASGVAGEYVNRTTFTGLNGTGGSGAASKTPTRDTGISCLSAQLFDGSKWISVPNDALPANQPFSISCWLRLETFYQVQTLYVDRLINFAVNHLNQLTAAVTGSDENLYTVQGATMIERDRYYHASVVVDPGNTLAVYLNGVLDKSRSLPSSTLAVGTNASYIGRSSTGGARFVGDIMDVRVHLEARDAAFLGAEYGTACTHLGLTMTGAEVLVG